MRVRYSFSSRRTGNIDNIRKQKQKFPNLAKDVIRISDIILEILDSRFIDETRNIELEDMIKRQNKELVYVLNKSDLVDIEEKKKEIKEKKLYPFIFISCKDRKGGGILRDKIKMLVKDLDIGEKQRAQVGIIGYPNTGKSSIINLITGRGSARTASESGFTKGIQKIRLAEGILLLDTPGVIPEKEYSSTKRAAIQKHTKIGVRTYDKVKDPEIIVNSLMQEYPHAIENFYGQNSNANVEILLESLGRKMNFLKKGNEVDTDRTARLVLKDWQSGKIRV